MRRAKELLLGGFDSSTGRGASSTGSGSCVFGSVDSGRSSIDSSGCSAGGGSNGGFSRRSGRGRSCLSRCRHHDDSRCRCFFFFTASSKCNSGNDSCQYEGLVHFYDP